MAIMTAGQGLNYNQPRQPFPAQAAFAAPPTGLSGSELALRGSMGAGLGRLDAGVSDARYETDAGANAAMGIYQPYAQQGGNASASQAALSGAMGAPAQQQAYDEFSYNPGQEFLRAEAEKGNVRNAAATGGLGGNNLKRALGRDAAAFASQAITDKFNQLGVVADRGFGAAGQQGSIESNRGTNLASIALGGSQNAANLISQTGRDVSAGRLQTGRDIAGASAATTSALADLQSQQGQGLANIYGQGTTNQANLVSGAGQASAGLQTQLATLLANIGTQTGSSMAQPTILAGQFDAAGRMGQNTAIQSGITDLAKLYASRNP